jgi:hypothetical protein
MRKKEFPERRRGAEEDAENPKPKQPGFLCVSASKNSRRFGEVTAKLV